MHCFPVGAALQDDGNLPSRVFLGGSPPPQPAEAPATKTSASAEAIKSGRIARGTRSNVQPDSELPQGELCPRMVAPAGARTQASFRTTGPREDLLPRSPSAPRADDDRLAHLHTAPQRTRGWTAQRRIPGPPDRRPRPSWESDRVRHCRASRDELGWRAVRSVDQLTFDAPLDRPAVMLKTLRCSLGPRCRACCPAAGSHDPAHREKNQQARHPRLYTTRERSPSPGPLVADFRVGHELPDLLSAATRGSGLGSPLQRLLA